MATPGSTEPVRIANCSGFYGDRLDGARGARLVLRLPLAAPAPAPAIPGP